MLFHLELIKALWDREVVDCYLKTGIYNSESKINVLVLFKTKCKEPIIFHNRVPYILFCQNWKMFYNR